MSGPDSSVKSIDYSKTSWIHELSKPQLIERLTQLKSRFEEKSTVDELRRILRTHVNKVNATKEQADNGEASDKYGTGSVANENKKPRLTHTVAGDSNNTKLEFQLGKDDWELYTERLELYFIANDVSAEKQVAVLLTKISAETYKLVRDLCAPAKPSEKKFTKLVALVKKHLNPKPSETMERCKFHQAHQAATETVADFAARLKSLSINCNFDNASVALRDQLVCGLKVTRQKKHCFAKKI